MRRTQPVLAEPLEPRRLMARALGIDVSHWQGTINWPSVASAGKVFAFQKATESTNYTDPTLATNMTGGKNAGLLMGVYHFARPDTSANDAANEANYFVSVAGKYMTSGWLHPVLDLEAGSALGKTVLSQWVNSFCATVKGLTGIDPLIYCNTNYATNYFDSSVNVHDLWIANWSTSYGDPTTTGSPPTGVWGSGGQAWDFWQYSDSGTVPGISGACDLDTYTSDLATLKTHFLIGYTPPPPSTGTVSGKVFNDTNGNGQLNSGEPYVASRTVYVDANNNGSKDTGELSTLTNSTGTYTFTLAPGAYTIREVIPSGWYQTVPTNNGGRSVTVVSGQTVSPFAFGTAKYGSISGVVFRDSNRNGKQDSGEAGLQGWTAYIDANNNGKYDTGERTTTTLASGAFTFSNLKTGYYTVRVVQKAGFTRTTPSGGYYINQILSGTVITTNLFGER